MALNWWPLPIKAIFSLARIKENHAQSSFGWNASTCGRICHDVLRLSEDVLARP